MVSCKLRDNSMPILFIFYLSFVNFSSTKDSLKDCHNQLFSSIYKIILYDHFFVIIIQTILELKVYFFYFTLCFDQAIINSLIFRRIDSIHVFHSNLINDLFLNQIIKMTSKIQNKFFPIF
jgi:hypothetical protein